MTNAQFEAFDPDKVAMGRAFGLLATKQKLERGETGEGLRPDRPAQLLEVYPSAQNLAGWIEYDKYGLGELEEMRYAGVKVDDDYIVFKTTQAKSVTTEAHSVRTIHG